MGLIGSSAKWARFRKQLIAAGHDEVAVERITCPIGSPGLIGKEPAVIAIGVAAALIPELVDGAVAGSAGRSTRGVERSTR